MQAIMADVSAQAVGGAQARIKALVGHASGLAAKGRSQEEVVADLTGRGVSAEAAHVIAAKGLELKRALYRKAGQRNILLGILVAGIGVAEAVAYCDGARPILAYVIAVAAIAIGVSRVLLGLQRLRSGAG